MKAFITRADPRLMKAGAAVFWLAVWQLGSGSVGQSLLLASPLTVARTLAAMLVDPAFWRALAGSCGHVAGGFFPAVAAGVALAAASAALPPLRALLAPAMAAAKSVPLASVVLLLLYYVSARSIAVPAVFLMVLPIIYGSTLEGIAQTDARLLEMARVFRVPPLRRAVYLYGAQALPYFTSACSSAVGLAWKSGVAAEVIGVSAQSVGEGLYRAKLYLLSGELFAWTIVVVAVSFGFERLFSALLARLAALAVAE